MVILALDLSSVKTGWSVIENGILKDFGEIILSKFKSKKNPREYLEILYQSINDLITQFTPSTVCVEDTFCRNVLTLKSLSKVRGIAELCVSENKINSFLTYTPSEARKKVFGKGNITKEEACVILSSKLNIALLTDGFDISDSIVIGFCCWENIK